MKITRQLIQRYLDRECSPEEEIFVKEWLAQHPEQLNKLMTEKSWDEFATGDITSVEASPRMFKYIVQKTRPRERKWKWMAAASVSLVLLSAGFFYTRSHETKAPELTFVKPTDIYILSTNNLTGTQKILLPDGSIVRLSSGSSIRYDSAFLHGRNIVLTGKASFSVAKDSTKPFCVHSKNINVTALGTVFSVSDQDPLLTSVRLYEGKVVVKKEGTSSRRFKEVFLKPGQELNFNNNDFSYQLTSIDKTAPQHHLPKMAKAPSKPIPALLNFDNQPLSDIFSELQKQYNIKIIFKTGTLEDLRFTGTHNPGSESLEDFLNTIAILNDLKVEKKPNAFIITPN